ncbi:unnamed protein product [Caenorhabditis brenneri]
MKQSSKYTCNGVYRCETFAQYVENDDFPVYHIGIASALSWYIHFKTEIIDDKTFVFPLISGADHPKVQARAYFKIIKKDGSSSFETDLAPFSLESDQGEIGKYMDVEELLNEDNGYLDDGVLTVEYGLQVESEQGEDGIWMFNCYDEFFDWQSQDNMFDFIYRDGSYWFGHKQIATLHSKKISYKDWVRVPESIYIVELLTCLQITHGVRLQMTAKELERTIEIASHFGFTNTVRYCEQQLIKMDEQTKMKLTKKIKLAVKFKLERYSNHLVKQIKSV